MKKILFAALVTTVAAFATETPKDSAKAAAKKVEVKHAKKVAAAKDTTAKKVEAVKDTVAKKAAAVKDTVKKAEVKVDSAKKAEVAKDTAKK